MENPRIVGDVIEAQEFLDLVQHYRVRGVPKIVINDRVEFEGAVPEHQFLAQLRKALPQPEAPQSTD